MKTLIQIAFVLATLVSFSTVAMADKSDWFLGKDRYEIGKLLRGKLLLEIECKDSKTPGLHIARDQYRVTYTDNPDNIRYRWAVGNRFGPNKKWADKNGYKLVSVNQFTRASGLKIRCAVWHKK